MVPNLTPEQIESHVVGVTDVQFLGQGGQKAVFRCNINGSPYALKFSYSPDGIPGANPDSTEAEEDPDVIVRTRREVETMRDCKSNHMVKLGPIGLGFVEIEGDSLLYFTEELIEGEDLAAWLRSKGKMDCAEIVRLGLHIADAIKALWDLGKIHRDIKPGNIMRRTNGEFVLLDAGLAFDVAGESLSGGFLVGTRIYFSPEQFDYSNRRTGLDFRSDMFALGVTMYQMLTGVHPFWKRGDSSETFYSNVTSASPPKPSEIASDVPELLDEIILRLLGKAPHLRYRKCDQLINALKKVEVQ